MSRLQSIRSWASRISSSPSGRKFIKVVRVLLGVAVVSLLVWQLSNIGWSDLLDEMPRTPWFYVIVVAMYVVLPFTETAIYGSFWDTKKSALLSVFFRKKVLNSDLMGYSGDVYVAFWAKENTGHSQGKILRLMVDNGIMSSLGALTATGVLFGILLGTASIQMPDVLAQQDGTVYFGALVVALVLSWVGYRFRHAIFSLPGKSILALYGTHFTRFMVMFVLQVLQWWVVLPETPFHIWGTMLAIVTVTNRLPFLAGRDLVATSIILGIGGLLGPAETAVAAMLVTRSVLERVFNLFLFVPLSLADKSK